ncbi:MAG: hypothetical protein ACRDBQ_22005 [Shewanella sp.]
MGLTRSRKSANHRAEFLLAAPQQELRSAESNGTKFCLHLALSGIEPVSMLWATLANATSVMHNC